jgi:hypothetical protein
VHNPTGDVRICNFGMFSLEFDLFVKSLTIFEKGPPTQPSLILLTSNYCHPPPPHTHTHTCTSKVVFVGLTHWSVEIPSYYSCCVCCVVFLSSDLPSARRDLLVRSFRWYRSFTLAELVRLHRQPYSTVVDSRIANPDPDCTVCNNYVTIPLCDRIFIVDQVT